MLYYKKESACTFSSQRSAKKRAFNILACHPMSFTLYKKHSEDFLCVDFTFLCVLSLALSVCGLRSEGLYGMNTHTHNRPDWHDSTSCVYQKQHLYIECPLVLFRNKGPHLSFPSERGRTSVSIRVCIRVIMTRRV